MRLPSGPDTRTLAALDSFLALGLLGVYLKYALMGQQWDAVARFLGKNQPSELALTERLGFFSIDIVLNLLVVPLVGTLLVRVVFRRATAAAAFVVATLMSLAYFIELRAQTEVGQYISRDVLRDLVGWSVANPGMGSDYVTVASVIKLLGLIGMLAAIALVARLAARSEHRGEERAAVAYRRVLSFPSIIVIVAAAVAAPISHANRLPDSLLNASAVGRAARSLIGANGNHDDVEPLTFEQAIEASRRLTGTPSIDASHPFVGRERDSDVIIFMMETGPTRALDIMREGPTLPGAGLLYDRSLVAERHYTTHPYSSDAMYSILSGLYPQGRRLMLRTASETLLNALMTARREESDVRRVYVPSIYHIELDDRMHAVFGAETLYAADEAPSDPVMSAAAARADALIARLEQSGDRFERAHRERLFRRLRADFQALERMKADIAQAVRAGERYCVMFFPQIGHAPWIALRPTDSVLERGRAVVLLQDEWLKEIVDTVRGLGRLEHTVIAVTADHGIRTRAEDPALPVGRISDYMFRVPLLVYAPQTLAHTLTIVSPTSHVDFAPTLLALLGETESAARMQGVPIWQRSAADRLYLLAAAYGGADGFVQDGTYYMRQAMSGAVYRNRDFVFSDEDQARPGDPVIPFVNAALADADALQQTIVVRALESR